MENIRAVANERRSLLSVQKAAKAYGGIQVFSDINLDISYREIVSVVGPSGCGKTTLLRCMDGLIQLDHGTVSMDGESVMAPCQGVAMVFQHFGLFPWKTVYENVAFGLRMAKVDSATIRERVPHYLKMVGLQDFALAHPHQFSGGMQQRCGLARALAIEPKVLLMDEPFAAIDAQAREIFQFELYRIWQQRPLAMVFVTHSIEEAVLMGHRIVILKGRPAKVREIIKVDLPEERDRTVFVDPKFSETREYVWNLVMSEVH